MPEDAVLEGLDPYDLMDREAARLDRHLSSLDATALERPTACAGWTVKDMAGHLASSEMYNEACLDDAVPALFERLGAAGVTDVNSFNAYGVDQYRSRDIDATMADWRTACGRTRRELRQRDGDALPTAVGPYPVRWQAFHLASELATHADDVQAPVDADEAGFRRDWRARFGVFAVAEVHPEVTVERSRDGVRVAFEGNETTLSDDDFIAATNGRLPDGGRLDPSLRAALNVVGS